MKRKLVSNEYKVLRHDVGGQDGEISTGQESEAGIGTSITGIGNGDAAPGRIGEKRFVQERFKALAIVNRTEKQPPR